MLHLASQGMLLKYQVKLENGSTVTNVYGADPEQGFILAYVNGQMEMTPDGARFRLKDMKPERVYCNFKLINPLTGEEVH